jgi:hypothetical protein
MKNKISLIALLFLWCSSSLPAQIELSTDEPVAGEAVTITLDEPVQDLIITYRPNSSVIRHDTLRAGAPATAFTWTPAQAGVVALAAGDATRTVSVRFSGLSWKGILVMVIAAAILFGGAAFAFKTMFRDEEEDSTMDYDTSPLRHPDT